MTATAADAVAIFDGFVGITEAPPHSNHTAIGREYGWDGVAWCCESCSVVLNRAFGHHVLWTAGVADAIGRAGRGENGLVLLPKDAALKVGDLVTFDWEGRGNPNDFHIEMCRNPSVQSRFQDDGGNVQDSVMQPWRDRQFVSHIIRPPYAGQPALVPPNPLPSPDRHDQLHAGQELAIGQELRSNSGLFLLLMQADGNAVLYREGTPRQPLWATNTRGGVKLAMQGDDNLVAYGPGDAPLWSSNTAHRGGTGHVWLAVQDDGNLVIYRDIDGHAVWDRHATA